MKMICLILAELKSWEQCAQSLKVSGILICMLQEIIHEVKLYMKSGEKHLVHVHQRIFLDTILPKYKIDPRSPVHLLQVLGQP